MVACNDCSVASKDRSQDPVFRKVLWVALLVNLLMFFVEIVASHIGDSMSLQADALDSLAMQQTMQSVYLYWAWHFNFVREPRL